MSLQGSVIHIWVLRFLFGNRSVFLFEKPVDCQLESGFSPIFIRHYSPKKILQMTHFQHFRTL